MSVCHNCQRRTATCHATCPDYAGEVADNKKKADERRKVRPQYKYNLGAERTRCKEKIKGRTRGLKRY